MQDLRELRDLEGASDLISEVETLARIHINPKDLGVCVYRRPLGATKTALQVWEWLAPILLTAKDAIIAPPPATLDVPWLQSDLVFAAALALDAINTTDGWDSDSRHYAIARLSSLVAANDHLTVVLDRLSNTLFNKDHFGIDIDNDLLELFFLKELEDPATPLTSALGKAMHRFNYTGALVARLEHERPALLKLLEACHPDFEGSLHTKAFRGVPKCYAYEASDFTAFL